MSERRRRGLDWLDLGMSAARTAGEYRSSVISVGQSVPGSWLTVWEEVLNHRHAVRTGPVRPPGSSRLASAFSSALPSLSNKCTRLGYTDVVFDKKSKPCFGYWSNLIRSEGNYCHACESVVTATNRPKCGRLKLTGYTVECFDVTDVEVLSK